MKNWQKQLVKSKQKIRKPSNQNESASFGLEVFGFVGIGHGWMPEKNLVCLKMTP